MTGPQPGKLEQRVTFRRRALGAGGQRTGQPEDYFSAWGAWRPLSAQQLVEAGSVTDAVTGVLTVPDTPRARALVTEDRAVFRGQDLAIVSAAIPDGSGFLALQLTRKIGRA